MPHMTCEILETLVEFPEARGWHKELNLIKWGDNPPKYDLRPWNEDRSRMGKGITLSWEELIILKEGLGGIKNEHQG